MTYDEEERVERQLFSMPYRATAAEARRVYLDVMQSPHWLEHLWRDDVLKSPGSGEAPQDIRAMARQSCAHYRELMQATARAIEAMEADR